MNLDFLPGNTQFLHTNQRVLFHYTFRLFRARLLTLLLTVLNTALNCIPIRQTGSLVWLHFIVRQ
jgi:hypothetical protein